VLGVATAKSDSGLPSLAQVAPITLDLLGFRTIAFVLNIELPDFYWVETYAPING